MLGCVDLLYSSIIYLMFPLVQVGEAHLAVLNLKAFHRSDSLFRLDLMYTSRRCKDRRLSVRANEIPGL